MFKRVAKNIIRREIVRVRSHSRAFVTSGLPSWQQHLAKTDDDIVVDSPFPSLEYPDFTLEQYFWENTNQWGSRTALVGKTEAENCPTSFTRSWFVGWWIHRPVCHFWAVTWHLPGLSDTVANHVQFEPWRHHRRLSSQLNRVSGDRACR